ICITGGIATGKSAVTRLFRTRLPAAAFFDADQTARDLTASDTEVRQLIAQTFGPEIYSAGDLNRAALRAIIFADPEKKRALEQILHPRIRRQWAAEAESHRGPNQFFLADIPLLYETGGESLCDRVVVVACAAATQLQRLMARSSLSREAAEQMIAAQMPLTEKMKRADHVIWNNGPRTALALQVETLANLWPQAQ
ncbi:MAG: dephospho-CoA kinase, partial [Verrucomicrobiota bacterium]|nr:dephospho-CoA kinase [Verrucomicrobiota bacterium]